MTKSTNTLIRQLEKTLPDHGHLAKPVGNETLLVRLPAAATAIIHADSTGAGLVIQCCWAANASGKDDPGAILAKCTETAFKLPLVQVQHDPQDGEVRLRVDCFGSNNGTVAVEHVVRSLTALNDFLAAIVTTPGPQKPASGPEKPATAGSQPAQPAAADATARLEALARKPGGINRLERLLRLNQRRRPPAPPSSN